MPIPQATARLPSIATSVIQVAHDSHYQIIVYNGSTPQRTQAPTATKAPTNPIPPALAILSAAAAWVTVVPGAVGVAGALITEVLPRIDVGAAPIGSRVDVSVSRGLRTPSVCIMLVTAPLVTATGGFGRMAAGLNRVKVGMTTETMAQEDEEEEDAASTEDGAGMTVVQPETFFAPLVRVTVEEIRTTVCKVEVEETMTSVIEGATVRVLGTLDGEEVIVVRSTLDCGEVVVIVDP